MTETRAVARYCACSKTPTAELRVYDRVRIVLTVRELTVGVAAARLGLTRKCFWAIITSPRRTTRESQAVVNFFGADWPFILGHRQLAAVLYR